MSKVNSYKSAYRAEIDGLRAFAIISVVLFHAFPKTFTGGFIGVDVFFVISGYLITGHIFEKLDVGTFSFSDFFARRIRRIFPALILVMITSLIFGWFALLPEEYEQVGKHIAGGAAFIVNFMLVGESGYFDNAAETKPMLHLWSLAVEEQFYIVWPLVLWIAWKRKISLLAVTIAVAALSFYLNLRFVNSKPVETFFWPVGRFWELLSGSILAWLHLYKADTFRNIKISADRTLQNVFHSKDTSFAGVTISNAMSLLGLLLLIFGTFGIDESLPFPSGWALVPVLGAILVISAGEDAKLSRYVFVNRVAIWFGLISYPLYLWHWPILSFLQIYEGRMPHRDARLIAIALAILLAWLTVRFVERPIRFSNLMATYKVPTLIALLFVTGFMGLIVSKGYLTHARERDDVILARPGFEHAIGTSLKWYSGKDGWLFLGNIYDDVVAKLKLDEIPTEKRIEKKIGPFKDLAQAAAASDTRVALILGPNKSSVYREFLPDALVPSEKRYSTFFTDRLKDVENLQLYDPTEDLKDQKASEGLLYWKTDTHWNSKGAFIAYKGLADLLDLPIPDVRFVAGGAYSGDLISMSGLRDFPLPDNDNWRAVWSEDRKLTTKAIPDQAVTSFGEAAIVINAAPLTDKIAWVVGDSFTEGLKDYFNATFKEVHYLGHWADGGLERLPEELGDAAEKPDVVIMVRSERSF